MIDAALTEAPPEKFMGSHDSDAAFAEAVLSHTACVKPEYLKLSEPCDVFFARLAEARGRSDDFVWRTLIDSQAAPDGTSRCILCCRASCLRQCIPGGSTFNLAMFVQRQWTGSFQYLLQTGLAADLCCAEPDPKLTVTVTVTV